MLKYMLKNKNHLKFLYTCKSDENPDTKDSSCVNDRKIIMCIKSKYLGDKIEIKFFHKIKIFM